MGLIRIAKWLVGLSLMNAVSAGADAISCLPEYTSLRATADFADGPSQQTFKLKSDNLNGLFESKARMTASYDAELERLNLKFHWDENFSGVSLPYNLYSVLILQGSTVVGLLDFTDDCRGLGVGFYPGQSFSARPIKIQGLPGKQFKFIVWGRIN